MPNEQALVENIRAAIASDPQIAHAAEVAVGARGGTVTLRGTVRSFHQRRVAVEVAKAVPGVRKVEDELRVDPREHFRDDEIRGAALQALMSDDDVPDGVDVHVASAWVTLKGEVRRQRESDAAFNAVSGVAGVGGVTNTIKVVSPGPGG